MFSLLFSLKNSGRVSRDFLKSPKVDSSNPPKFPVGNSGTRNLYQQRGGLKITKKASKIIAQSHKVKVEELNVRFVFIPELTNTTDPAAAQLNEILADALKGMDPEVKERIFKNILTNKNIFKAMILIEDNSELKLAGFASGKYNTGSSDFAKVAVEGFLKSSEIRWIEILSQFRNKKLCQAFMEFLLNVLYDQGVDNVKVENVGGIAACICYLKAAKKVKEGTRGFFAIETDSTTPWFPIDIKDCTDKYKELNYIFFPRDETVKRKYTY